MLWIHDMVYGMALLFSRYIYSFIILLMFGSHTPCCSQYFHSHFSFLSLSLFVLRCLHVRTYVNCSFQSRNPLCRKKKKQKPNPQLTSYSVSRIITLSIYDSRIRNTERDSMVQNSFI